jgi:hypothetical protein
MAALRQHCAHSALRRIHCSAAALADCWDPLEALLCPDAANPHGRSGCPVASALGGRISVGLSE